MSILEMQKIRLLMHKSYAEDVVDVVQEHGVLEIKESESIVDAHAKNNFSNLLPRVESISEFLKGYDEKKGSIFEKKPILSESYCKEVLYEFDYESILENADELREKIRSKKQEIKDLKTKEEAFFFWKDLPFSIPDDLRTEHTKTALFVPVADIEKNENSLYEVFKKEKIKTSIFVGRNGGIAVTHFIDDEDSVSGILKREGFEETHILPLPDDDELGGSTPAKALDFIARIIEKREAELSALEKEARNLSNKYSSVFLVLKDLMTWEKDKEEALKHVNSTDSVLIIEGWCPKKKLDALMIDINKRTDVFAVKKIKPKKGDIPPVEIDNPSIFKPLESVTRLYGLPGYRDLDPTMYLAVFFVISFGLALTDLGYGIFLMLASMAALVIFKLKGLAKLYAGTLFAGGAASAFFGLLTGGFLGVDSSSLPVFMQNMQKFDIIGNPLSVFYLSLSIGVVQIFFGIILKIVREHKNNNLKEGVITQAPWLFMFISGILYGASRMGYVEGLSEVFLWMIYGSVASIILSGFVVGKGMTQKIGKGFSGLYTGIGYFSDILSYSRLFALGLATTALAFSVNLIAMIIIDMVPVVGYVLAAIVLVAGHAFNVVVNTLGAFIHSARLQFVEFFGKFIEETGKQFKPLERKSSYIVLEEN